MIVQPRDTEEELKYYEKAHNHFWEILTNARGHRGNQSVKRKANDNIPLESTDATYVAIPTLAIMSAVFGCLHLIVWNFEFPTAVEQLL